MKECTYKAELHIFETETSLFPPLSPSPFQAGINDTVKSLSRSVQTWKLDKNVITLFLIMHDIGFHRKWLLWY